MQLSKPEEILINHLWPLKKAPIKDLIQKFLLLFSFMLFLWSCNPDNEHDIEYEKLKSELDQLGQDDIYSGNWLIADNDTILLNQSYGVSNIDKDIPITTDTRFNLASMNKMFTAVTIMQLRDKGLIDLDKTIRSYLEDYPNKQIANQVTIDQLLTHTSGMGDMFTPAFEQADHNSIRGLDDYLDKFVMDSLLFEPGEKLGYSNAGYIVLGLIIEKVTGQDYYDYVRQNLFLPLGMTNTGWYHGDSLYHTVATAYAMQDSIGNWLENPYLIIKGSSAGGGYSTVTDLLLFARALESGKVVPESTLKEMTEDRYDNGYGYGLSIRMLNDQKAYGHNGGFPGVSGEVDIFPDLGLYVVSLSNRGPRDGWATARSMVRNTIVGKTEESEGVLNADRLIEIYNAKGLEETMPEISNLNGEISVNQLISVVHRYDEVGEAGKALDIITICSIIEPENWFPISIMADHQIANGDTLKAINNWKKSLELNPDNQWAKDRLRELNK